MNVVGVARRAQYEFSPFNIVFFVEIGLYDSSLMFVNIFAAF